MTDIAAELDENRRFFGEASRHALCCWGGLGDGFMKPIIVLFAIAGLALTLAGCSVAMAAHQPSRKDVKVFSHGMPRSLVVAEVGAPVTTESRAGQRVEVYAFTQGYSKAARVSRTIGHGAADVFTLGLWEVVGTPTEAAFNGKRIVCEVTYDAADRVEKVVVLKK